MTDTDTTEQPAADAESAGLDVRIAQELIEQARAQGVSLVGPGGLLAQVTKTVLQTALDTEMTEHLGYAKGDRAARGRGNHRNGSSAKTVRTEVGPVRLEIPRDRAGSFDPQIVRRRSSPRCTARLALGDLPPDPAGVERFPSVFGQVELRPDG